MTAITPPDDIAPAARPYDIALFLAITFGVTWAIGATATFFPDWFVARFGAFGGASPMFYIAVWTPSFAALILTVLRGGPGALRDLLSRLLRWRVAPWVWIAAIGFYPVLMIIVLLTGLAFGRPLPGAGAWPVFLALVTSLPLLALGPLGEELGWRGYLLPRLLRFSPAVAGLIVGAIWMTWHIPAFLVSGLPQSNMDLGVFIVGGIALSVFVTWLFVNARQSVLIAGIIPHAIVNAWGDATGPMTWINAVVLVGGAALLIAVLGPQLRRAAPPRLIKVPRKGL